MDDCGEARVGFVVARGDAQRIDQSLPSRKRGATILVVRPPRDRPMACVWVPPRAPVPCWCTRTIVPSTITYSKSASADKASKILPKTPSRLHRRNLRKTEFHFPKYSGRSRHGAPTRTIQRTASRKSRLSAADLPGSPALPGTCGAIRSHWSSRRTIRSKGHLLVGSLEPNVSSTGNSPIDFECQQALVLQLDFPFGSSVQVHHPTSYTASSGVFPRRIRTECVREVKRFHNEKGKGNCSTRPSR